MKHDLQTPSPTDARTRMQKDSCARPASEQLAKKRFSISSRVIPGLMIALDTCVILSSALILYAALVAFGDFSYYAAATAFVWLVAIMLMNFAGLYKFDAITRPFAFGDKILIVFVTTFCFLLAAAFALKISTEYSRLWTGSFALSSLFGTLLFRIIAAQIIGRLSDRQVFSRNVVIVGSGEQMARLLDKLYKSQSRFITVLGVFVESGEDMAANASRYAMLGTVDDLPSYIRGNNVDDVIICLPWSADGQITQMLDSLRELPVNAYLGSDLIGFRLPIRPAPDHFEELPLVEVMGKPLAGWGGIQKAALDYGLGLILTIMLLPMMILIVIAIRLESKGPALFRQRRYGFINRVFEIYKFRTMRVTQAPEEKIVQARRDDPRVTRVGRILRRLSLDELPQIFNVLNGTMSLVGPRPHAVQHNEEYAQTIRGYFARHRVKPGMTGWAQVNGFRGETKTLEKMQARVQYDIYYVENWSLLLDLKILLMTAVICLTGRNAY
jgi:putative colanic acid biosysnthesis UDP-glucose lipid carrier transferase